MARATKTTQKRLDAAHAAFNARYSTTSQWGEERWHGSLYPALARSTKYCAMVNLYAVDEEKGSETVSPVANGDGGGSLRKLRLPSVMARAESNRNALRDKCHIQCYEREEAIEKDVSSSHLIPSILFPAPKADLSSSDRLFTHWNLDAASVLAAHVLDVRPGDAVLDMCAAPGGKAVALAQGLFPHLHRGSQLQQSSLESFLHVNEFDTSRCKRLTGNLKSYLPASLFPSPEHPQAPIKVFNRDLSMKQSVSTLPLGPDGYDKVLVDAPCSSERHIIHAHEKAKAAGQIADEMLNWKASHVITLVKIQVGLLQTALKAVKVGGTIVYATCALSYEENDGVVEKVLENLKTDRKKAKRDGRQMDPWDIEVSLGSAGDATNIEDDVLDQMTEPTKYGRIALPDHGGRGPLYFCVLVKVERKGSSKDRTKMSLKSSVETSLSQNETKGATTTGYTGIGNGVSQAFHNIQLREDP